MGAADAHDARCNVGPAPTRLMLMMLPARWAIPTHSRNIGVVDADDARWNVGPTHSQLEP